MITVHPMTAPKVKDITASEVLYQIVSSNEAIEALWAVIYEDSPNWLDKNPCSTSAVDLKDSLKQDERPRRIFRVSRRDFLSDYLSEIKRGLSPTQLLAVTSKVKIRGHKYLHVPMMDFRCDISTHNVKLLTEMLPEIGLREGFILQSGRSYHFYGRNLMSRSCWRILMGKCLLMRNFVDERYVGHQLVDGYCVLRLSASRLKPIVPTLVATI